MFVFMILVIYSDYANVQRVKNVCVFTVYSFPSCPYPVVIKLFSCSAETKIYPAYMHFNIIYSRINAGFAYMNLNFLPVWVFQYLGAA